MSERLDRPPADPAPPTPAGGRANAAGPLGSDPRVKRIVRAWRALTSAERSRRAGAGSRTLVACSGGADSSALLLALAAGAGRTAAARVVAAHVVHDLRPRTAALADRDAVRALAGRLAVPSVEAEVAVRGAGGNAEAAGRRERYAALVRLAREHGCGFIATAHHADDQLETMLMAMLRGAGPRGLAGVAGSRRITGGDAGGVRIIRPMLGAPERGVEASTRADAEAICRAAGWAWREDETNADTRLLRNAIRREVAPQLERLRPGAARRAARSADLLGQASAVVRTRAAEVWGARTEAASEGGLGWARGALRDEPAIVVGEVLRLAARVLAGESGRDAMGRRAVAPAVRAIRDGSTEPRRFALGPVRVSVTARRVEVRGVRDG